MCLRRKGNISFLFINYLAMKLPFIIHKIIYMQDPDPKEFNLPQFILGICIFLFIYLTFLNFVISDCSNSVGGITKISLYLWACVLSVHLSYYQASNTTWDWTFYPVGPPGGYQVCIYPIFFLFPAILLGC